VCVNARVVIHDGINKFYIESGFFCRFRNKFVK